MAEASASCHVEVAWGAAGLQSVLGSSDVVVIVDVLSFSTAVDVAVGCGACIYPYAYGDGGAVRQAAAWGATLAQPRTTGGGQLSLSPQSLAGVEPGARIVLPSPNGSALSRMTGGLPTLAGCLRNAAAIARTARSIGGAVSVVAAGERWPNGGLRPAIEDLLGAGAIVERIGGRVSPEAEAMRAGYLALKERIASVVQESQSGQELIQAGFPEDVAIALEQDVSGSVPLLQDEAYCDAMAEAGPDG